jgi:predicted DNA-binding transcriptional regulator AlpA
MASIARTTIHDRNKDEALAISLKTLAIRLDASRDSVRRWLNDAGIRPIAMSNGAKGAIRYRWSEVQAWLQARAVVE